MGEPIRSRRLGDLAGAPTPQNTPATAASSFAQRAAASRPAVAPIAEEGNALSGLSNNPALLSMIQGKLNTLVGKPSGYVESLPQSVRDRIAALRAIQQDHSKLESEFQLELLELEKKFFAKYEPLYKRRAQIVAGDAEPTEQELETGRAIEKEDAAAAGEDDEDDEERVKEVEEEGEQQDDEKKAAEEEDDGKDIKGIPQFWLTSMKTMSLLAELITERDDEALQYLRDIRMEYLEQPGFALVFEFDENPFFTNKVLRKTYYYQAEAGYGGEFVYDHAEGDKIEWTSPENNLTVRVEKRKQRNKHTGATRTIEKTYPAESFFTFFSPPSADLDDEDEDEDPEALEEQLQVDYELGEFIKDKLIPHAVDWFTGKALDYEEDAYEDLDEDEFDDEDDEDAEDDDDDDDDDDDAPAGGAKQGEQPSDCKQS